MSCWVFFRRCSLCRGVANTAIHLSRLRLAVFFGEHTLRPGDGERWPASLKLANPALHNRLLAMQPLISWSANANKHTTPMAIQESLPRSVILIDGENLVSRYEDMLSQGLIVKDKLTSGLGYIRGVFIWHHYLIGMPVAASVIRCIYYTSAVGDDPRIREIDGSIRKSQYAFGREGSYKWQSVVPRIFKKENGSRPSKRVDIQICIDALTCADQGGIDEVFLFTGDGDFLPLIHELMRRNIRVNLYAFSSGCSDSIKTAGDTFTSLDDRLFDQSNDE